MDVLSGKVVVVTGGSRGIGRGIAVATANAGAAVVSGARSFTAPRAEPRPGSVVEAALDVTDERSVTKFFQWLDGAAGRIDALVNNAGTGVFKPIESLTLEEFRATLDTNLAGVFLCSREAFRRMKRARGGRVVTIGSVAGRVPLADSAAYGASKYGARGFSEILTEEGKAHGVFGTVVTLGAVATGIWNGREGYAREEMLSVEDVAASVVHLLSLSPTVRVDEIRIAPPKGILSR